MSQLSSVESAFYTGDHESVIAFDLTTLDVSETARARNLVIRAKIQVGQAHEAVEGLGSTGEDLALKTWAQVAAGDTSALESAKSIKPADDVERHLYALVLAHGGLIQEALKLLEDRGQNFDCSMLATYIYLAQHDVANALRVTDSMRSWANDHIVFNLCEAWVALAENGENAQKAFYIFEEHNAFKPTSRSFVGEAAAQLELRRLPEAAESIRRALEIEQSEDALATSIAIASAQNQEATELPKLQQLQHSVVTKDLKEKSELFDKVVQKYAQAGR